MSMKIYNIWLNTILTSGRFPELILVIVSPNGLPQIVQMACPFVLFCFYGRLSKEWTSMIRNEYNTMSMNIRWQWFIFYQIQFRHAAMPVYSGIVIVSPIDCPRWLPHFPGPHLADSRKSESQLSVTSWVYVCGVTMATMPTPICERWRQLQHIQFWLTQSI